MAGFGWGWDPSMMYPTDPLVNAGGFLAPQQTLEEQIAAQAPSAGMGAYLSGAREMAGIAPGGGGFGTGMAYTFPDPAYEPPQTYAWNVPFGPADVADMAQGLGGFGQGQLTGLPTHSYVPQTWAPIDWRFFA